jgi:hypothetical protein
LEHLLTYMLLFHYHGLWYTVYCWGWFCRFAIVDSSMWSPSRLDFFLLSMVHAGISLLCLNRTHLNVYLNRMGPHGDRSVVQMEDNIKMLTQCNVNCDLNRDVRWILFQRSWTL